MMMTSLQAGEPFVETVTFGALLALGLSFAATAVAMGVALRFGWTEGLYEGRGERQLGRRTAPAIGGLAILSALAVTRFVLGVPLFEVPFGLEETHLFLALGAACAVGLADDLIGLSPLQKLAGQAAASGLLVLPLAQSGGGSEWAVAALLLVGAMLAMNLVNTYDNADGAAVLLSGCGLLAPAPILAATVLGFAPFNLSRRLRANGTRPILGDTGSHLLGMLLFLNPWAWPVFALPLFDLLRVARVRHSLGRAPWHGDRRHLAHRLELAGLSTGHVALALLAIALPTHASALLAERSGAGALFIPAGVFATFSLFVWSVRRTPDPDAELSVPSRSPQRTAVLRPHVAPEPWAAPPEARASTHRERPRTASSLSR